jgi:hypothetical protein
VFTRRNSFVYLPTKLTVYGRRNEVRIFFWKRVFPFLLITGVLHEIGIPVLDWIALAVFFFLIIVVSLTIKTLVLGVAYGPTILSLAEFLGVNLPDEYYQFRPLIRIIGYGSDASTVIESVLDNK